MMRSFFKTVFEPLDATIEQIASLFFQTPEKRETVVQFIKFALIGVVNTIIDFGIYTALTRHTAFFDYHKPTKYLANCISFIVATTYSFYANRTWTFKRRDRPSAGEAARFYTTTLSGLLINNGILFVLNHYFAVNDLVSKAFSTIFSTLWNFIFKKFWVFTPAADEEMEDKVIQVVEKRLE